MRKTATAWSCLVAALLLIAPISAVGADAPATPATKAAAEPAADALRAARAFLRTVGQSDDKAAYELTAPAYRDANTAEQFAEQMATVRGAVDLSQAPPLAGWVLVKSKNGDAPRAAFTVGLHARLVVAEKTPTTVGVGLIQHEGRWLITEARELKLGRTTFEFTSSIRKAGKPGDEVRQATSAIRGVVIELKDGSLTITLAPRVGNPPADAPHRTLKIDENTQIKVVTFGTANVAGRSVAMEMLDSGSTDNLKPGTRITIEPSEDDARAVSIQVLPPAAKGDAPGL